MAKRDFYEALGVGRNASTEDIRKAYKKKVRELHPDQNRDDPEAEARFKEVNEAYEVLKDPEKRAAYDQLGRDWKQGQNFDPPPGWDTGFEFSGGGFTGSDASDFSDFFESLFGGLGGDFGGRHRGRTRGQAGEDHHARIAVDLEDAFQGAERTITLRMPQIDANGQVVNREHKLNVKIPKGIRPGQQIRLSGQGGKGPDGRAGDLYLTVEFKPHRLYRIEGKDLFLELPVAPWEAALGAKVKVPTPAGAVDMSVPAGSRSGQKLRLKGRGLPDKPAGDLYAVLRIAVPPADNDRARELYQQMREELDFDPRAGLTAA